VSLYEDYWHHVWPHQQWLWCIISHLLLLEVLISFGASATWQNVQICDILQVCFKKDLDDFVDIEAIFSYVSSQCLSAEYVPLGMLISLLVFVASCGFFLISEVVLGPKREQDQ